MAKPTLSFVMIGHNEAHLLPQALASIAWADEIIYVDCESQDSSPAVARGYSAKVFSQPNRKNLNLNKQFAIDQASGDWIFYLDPDERITPSLAQELRELLASSTPLAAFSLPRKNFFFGQWLRYGGQYPDWQLRLFRRGKASFPCRDVHESLDVRGKTGRLACAMEHHTCPRVGDSLRKMSFYAEFHGQKMLAEGFRPHAGLALRYLCLKPAGKFFRRYFLKGGFRDGWPGLIQAWIGSADFAFRFLHLWQHAQDARGGRDSAGTAGSGGKALDGKIPEGKEAGGLSGK